MGSLLDSAKPASAKWGEGSLGERLKDPFSGIGAPAIGLDATASAASLQPQDNTTSMTPVEAPAVQQATMQADDAMGMSNSEVRAEKIDISQNLALAEEAVARGKGALPEGEIARLMNEKAGSMSAADRAELAQITQEVDQLAEKETQIETRRMMGAAIGGAAAEVALGQMPAGLGAKGQTEAQVVNKEAGGWLINGAEAASAAQYFVSLDHGVQMNQKAAARGQEQSGGLQRSLTS